MLLGGIVAVLAKLALPTAFTSPMFVPITTALERYGEFITVPFLIIASVSALNGYKRRKLMVSQNELEDLRKLSWREFEVLTAEAFRRDGYRVTETGQGGADGGIDLVIEKDSKQSVVQCKRWKDRQVGVKPIRELYGVMVGEGADEAVFVASGGYTAEAMIIAKGKPIILVDGAGLLELVASPRGESAEQISPVIATNKSSERQLDDALSCPKCGSEMVLREAKKGKRKGTAFWGCVKFPRRRGTREQKNMNKTSSVRQLRT